MRILFLLSIINFVGCTTVDKKNLFPNMVCHDQIDLFGGIHTTCVPKW